MLEKFKSFRWGYILISLLIAAVGLCFLIWNETLKYLSIAIGVVTAVFGIVYFIINLAAKDRGGKFALRTVIAVCCIISGIITAIFNTGAVPVLVSLISLLLIIDGSFKLHTTAMSRRYHLLLWWFILVPAVLTITGAFFTLRLSDGINADNIKTVSILIGITMMIDALGNLLSAFYISKYEKNMAKEISEEVAEAKLESARKKAEKKRLKAEREARKEEKARKKFKRAEAASLTAGENDTREKLSLETKSEDLSNNE